MKVFDFQGYRYQSEWQIFVRLTKDRISQNLGDHRNQRAARKFIVAAGKRDSQGSLLNWPASVCHELQDGDRLSKMVCTKGNTRKIMESRAGCEHWFYQEDHHRHSRISLKKTSEEWFLMSAWLNYFLSRPLKRFSRHRSALLLTDEKLHSWAVFEEREWSDSSLNDNEPNSKGQLVTRSSHIFSNDPSWDHVACQGTFVEQ